VSGSQFLNDFVGFGIPDIDAEVPAAAEHSGSAAHLSQAEQSSIRLQHFDNFLRLLPVKNSILCVSSIETFSFLFDHFSVPAADRFIV
jgi:hypothetical protein